MMEGPPDDLARYFDATGDCLGLFRPDVKEPGRLLTFLNGAASGGRWARIVALGSTANTQRSRGS